MTAVKIVKNPALLKTNNACRKYFSPLNEILFEASWECFKCFSLICSGNRSITLNFIISYLLKYSYFVQLILQSRIFRKSYGSAETKNIGPLSVTLFSKNGGSITDYKIYVFLWIILELKLFNKSMVYWVIICFFSLNF